MTWQIQGEGDTPAHWRRVDGLVLRTGVHSEGRQPTWEVVIPTSPVRKGTLPPTLTLEQALAKIDEEHPLPSWAYAPGITNQRGPMKAHGSDCVFVAGTVREVPNEDPSEGDIRLQLATGVTMMRFAPDGQVVIQGEIVSRDDPWYYARFKPWLRAHAEAVTYGPEQARASFPREINVRPGEGARDAQGNRANDGSFIFRLANGVEILRFRYDAAFLLGGQAVPGTANRRAILSAFHVWLSQCRVESNPRQSR